ncbi:biopolymer transporter ExbD [Helicobacter sp. MIT 05-5293]|uniref:Putative biopolymer transport protein ExbD-like 1 n=1 Tax=uncultured Helicobacter sp. TaxID=175537 RepID=A0A650EMD4_9HELI|nr:biopolymer transporter ExbD [Helicobacter sp. MIT 05-5293]QGT50044.1 putative biopolymer transport protein ExbD-like 1 [uncultured Helicobacter sp.]TLD81750.1 biopolymer transporter ExbD [Helicobacter sp. MIT 05-5293]
MNNDDFEWEEKPELNITPLVDIMLVLLAILMVSTPTITYQEDITLPKGSKTKKLAQDSMLEIRVSANRKIHIRDQVYEFNNFADSFVLFSKNLDKNLDIFIRADKNLKYEDVIYILKVAKESGFVKVSLITSS